MKTKHIIFFCIATILLIGLSWLLLMAVYDHRQAYLIVLLAIAVVLVLAFLVASSLKLLSSHK